MNFNQSTQEMIGYLEAGMRVETAVLANTSYLIQAQVELFNVFGTVKILALYGEIITAMSATATTLKFNATFTTPSIAAADLCGASASLSGAARGLRVMSVGGAVATAAVITASAGISDIAPAAQIVGMEGGIGTIGQVTAGANATSGTTQFFVHYVPLSAGAYISNVL